MHGEELSVEHVWQSNLGVLLGHLIHDKIKVKCILFRNFLDLHLVRVYWSIHT